MCKLCAWRFKSCEDCALCPQGMLGNISSLAIYKQQQQQQQQSENNTTPPPKKKKKKPKTPTNNNNNNTHT